MNFPHFFSPLIFFIHFFCDHLFSLRMIQHQCTDVYSFNKSAFFRVSWMGWLPTTKDIAVTSVKVTQITFLNIIIRQKDQTIINVNDSCIVFFSTCEEISKYDLLIVSPDNNGSILFLE